MKKLDIKSKFGLFGIFEGRAQGRRINIGAVLPDRITLFRVPIMNSCDNIETLKKQISKTLRHEIAHHFGSDELGAINASKKFSQNINLQLKKEALF